MSGQVGTTERQITASERLTLRAANLTKAAEPAMPYDLRHGIAPGAGITLGLATARQVAVEPPNLEHERPGEVEVPFRSQVLFDQDLEVEPLEPLPIAGAVPAPPTAPRTMTGAVTVQGILCSRGHFNNPDAQFCMLCGISMVHVTHNLVPGPRPTLGFVVFDDGSTFGLDRGYLIGREPGPTADSHVAPLTIRDNNETLSRRHAELRLVDWSVHLVDLESTNGSYVWDLSAERWNQIPPNHPVPLTAGDTVALGRRTFVFESVTAR